MVKGANIFIKKMLPGMINRDLTKEEKEFYGKPYKTVNSREPLLAWPQDVSFSDGKATAATSAVKSWAPWIAKADIPKLCFYVTPGVAIKEKDVKVIKDTFKNIELINFRGKITFHSGRLPTWNWSRVIKLV